MKKAVQKRASSREPSRSAIQRAIQRRGQGLSLETIIIAVIALIVLVVIIMIFTGKTGEFGKQSSSCVTKGGECIGTDEICRVPGAMYTCPDATKTCCITR